MARRGDRLRTLGLGEILSGKGDFLERSDGAILGIEVKSGSVGTSDFSHLKWFRDNLAKGVPFTGVVLNSGAEVLPFGEGMYAVPLSTLGV